MNPDHKRIESLLARVPNDATRILDVGCVRHDADRRDRGNLHARLVKEYPQAEVVGIDLPGEETRRMQAEGYNVYQKNAETFEFDRLFDVIVAGELIEHLPNPGNFLSQAEKHLSHDGVILLSTPNPNHIRWDIYALAGKWTSAEHTCWISPYQLETLVERATKDLTVIETEWIPPFPLYRLAYLLYKRMGSPQYVAEVGYDA